MQLLNHILSFLICLVILYPIGALVALDFNLRYWTSEGRFLWIALAALMASIY